MDDDNTPMPFADRHKAKSKKQSNNRLTIKK